MSPGEEIEEVLLRCSIGALKFEFADGSVTEEAVDDTMGITIVDLCRSCAVDAGLVEAMIDEGTLEPVGKSGGDWCFPYIYKII